MKKIFLSLLALVALTVVACGPNKAVEAQKTLLTESIAKIDSIQTMADFQAFQQEFAAQQSAFMTENADAMKEVEAGSEEAKVLEDLNAQWVAKMQSKSDELVALQMAADSDTMTVIETAEVKVVKK
ncbi:MAG: hypothetical protein RR980_00900 [Mucinivorans sp.]